MAAKKGEIWSEEECLALLSAWGDKEILKKLCGTLKISDVYKSPEALITSRFSVERKYRVAKPVQITSW